MVTRTPAVEPRGGLDGVDPLDALVVGIDLGGTKILGRAFDVRHPTDVVATARADTPAGGEAIVEAIVEVVQRLHTSVAEAGRRRIAAVGVGAAGLIDHAGVLRFAPNLPTVIALDLAGALETAFRVPAVVDNDANCAVVAEHRLGAAMGADHAVLVALGTGIGAGVVVGGRLVRGAAGFAGEAGHMVVDPNGPPCPCGRRGCWERFASGTGLARLARDAVEAGTAERILTLASGEAGLVQGEHVTRAALEGDPGALAILRSFGWWVALGIANIVNLLDCQTVVIGGGLVEAGDSLLVPVREAYDRLVLATDHRPPIRIVPAALGSGAGALGAGLLAGDALAARSSRPSREG